MSDMPNNKKKNLRQEPAAKNEERKPNPNLRKKGRKARKAKKAKKKDSNAFVWAILALVVVAVGAMFVMSGSPTKPPKVATNEKLSASEMAQLSNVPAAVLEAAGDGGGGLPTRVPAGTPPLTSNGKPEVVYIGAEFCPYCAGERWPLAEALTRFGTFTDLTKSASGPSPEAFPNTPTLTFYGSTYTSDYLVFTPVETATSDGTPLQQMTPEQKKLMDAHSNKGGIPFLDVGGLWIKNGSSVPPELISVQGMTTVTQVLDSLSDPTNPVGMAVNGSANALTAAICDATGGKPADVCNMSAVKAAAASLKAGG